MRTTSVIRAELITTATALVLCGLQASRADCLPAPPKLLEAGVLTIGSALSAPPMGFVKDGKPAGFDPEMITAVAERMCLRPRIVNLSFQGLFPGLIAGKFDVIASQVGITDARREVFDFVPVFVGGLRLVTAKGSPLRLETEMDVCGHSASIVAGSSQMAALDRVKGSCPAGRPMTLKVFSSQVEALNEVAKRNVDVAYVDWPVAADLIQQRPNDFAEASPILSGKGPGTPRNRNGIVIRKGDDATRDAIEASVKAVMASGTYEQILRTWNLAGGDLRKAD